MPLRDKRGYLWDILDSARAISGFTEGKQFADYVSDAMLRRAVEREFTIVGEAFTQAKRFFPEVAQGITNMGQIIAFRNRLIHVYADIDPELVWGVIEDDLPRLIGEVEALLEETDEASF